MKSNVPWSIKGIDPETREVAKKAAREAGMTLGEWLNKNITVMGTEEADQDRRDPPADVVSIDQLQQVVNSLNRLNQRLKNNEQTSREAFTNLNNGLSSVLDRVRRVETEKPAGSDPFLAARVEELENGGGVKQYIDSFAALEKALQHMVADFEATRDETLARVDAHDEVIRSLSDRVAEADQKNAAAIEEVRGFLDTVTDQLRKTETTSKALMLEAKAAAQSDDAEFIERTSNKLRILGTEIKRSGDQIQALESNIQKMTDKLEGAEQRSAEGITRLSQKIEDLRTDLSRFDEENGQAARDARAAISATTDAANQRIQDLHGSFQKMIQRFDGVAEGAEAYRDMTAAGKPAATPPEQPRSALQTAMSGAERQMPAEEDFDDVFGDEAEDPSEVLIELDVDQDEDEQAPPPVSESKQQLTAKQKVILAARARRKRLEKDAELDAEQDASADADTPEEAGEEVTLINKPARKNEKISALRQKYGTRDRNRLPLIIIGGLVLLAIMALIFLLLRGNQSGTISAVDGSQVLGPDASPIAPGRSTGSSATELTAEGQFIRWQTLSSIATNEEEERRALIILKQAASRNYPPAQYALAEDYRTGRFGEQNEIMARNWYQAAAEGGNITAMHKLGSMYALGAGGARNESTAISWFEQAAAYGYVDSIYNLALIYDPTIDLESNSTTPKSTQEAYYWYALAGKLGDGDANSEATRLGLLLPADQRREIDARLESWVPRQAIASAN
ncbi:tetratricopeptide repeat protein [Parvularcula sp. IMCC14364]|uniref:tetratricopeptide repeat protein n=1 Tax=Parvularcula sp. IMCC14364 TaxID=3067902 RepID=UPI0027425624|nr:hypothetical protein [Parvularcula sp. IMCC14364]